ncbi:MAG: hypothetical protein M3167_02100 [Acidobacteriota bacterium]|nr:hypothetical protein [Acidobacteriota bacterium]
MELSREMRHLTDAELFGIALPAAGAPEALPEHLSDCLPCTRALTEWKAAVRDVGAEGDNAVARRSPEEWEEAQAKTMASVRRSRFEGRTLPLRWAMSVAAVLLLFAVAIPLQRSASLRQRSAAQGSSELSAQDQADDTLLRDVARLSRGDDGSSWGALAPEPNPATHGEEERL